MQIFICPNVITWNEILKDMLPNKIYFLHFANNKGILKFKICSMVMLFTVISHGNRSLALLSSIGLKCQVHGAN